MNPPGVTSALRAKIDLEDMALSKETAAAVALRRLGRKVVIRPIGALVDAVIPGEPAVGKLAPDDVITEVGNTRITGPAGVFTAMSKVTPGQTVSFTFKRLGQTRLARIRTVPRPGAPKSAVVGIEVDSQPAVSIHLPIPVRIDTGNVGGSSAGLAFALEVLEELGPDFLHGNKIAATGRSTRRQHRCDRRDQAKDVRGPRRTCERVPCTWRGERGRRGEGRGQPADHPCEDFSTGVAGLGNIAARTVETSTFRPV